MKAKNRFCRNCGKRLVRKRYSRNMESPSVFKMRMYCGSECNQAAKRERRAAIPRHDYALAGEFRQLIAPLDRLVRERQ